jgi:N-acetylneuraminic acid mutarotase
MFLFGGTSNEAKSLLKPIFYSLDLKTFAWSELISRGEVPSNRDEHTAIMYENTMIIFGGFNHEGERVNDIHRYYFKENKWEQVLIMGGEIPCSRSGHSSVLYGDSMIVFGGRDSDNNRLNDLWEFNFATYQWAYIPALQSPLVRSGHSACIYKDYMVVFGGIFEVTKELDDMHLFDIRTKRWIEFFEELKSPVGKRKTTFLNETISIEGSPKSRNQKNFSIKRPQTH